MRAIIILLLSLSTQAFGALKFDAEVPQKFKHNSCKTFSTYKL